jgi:ferritin-like metal-binding protein YciE
MAEETNPLEELLIDELKDIYSAENQIVKALPKLAKAASSPELKRAFERHLEETRRQVERLDQIGQALDTKLTGKKCKGMEGLIEEGKEIIEEDLETGRRKFVFLPGPVFGLLPSVVRASVVLASD